MSQVTDEIVEVARNAGIAFFEDNPVDGEFDLGIYRAALEAILPLIVPAGEGKAVVKPRGNRYATYTYEANRDVGRLYYFSLADRSPPPYRNQRHVDAIFDIAEDGTLAGVELIEDMPPAPAPALTLPPSSDSEKLIEALVWTESPETWSRVIHGGYVATDYELQTDPLVCVQAVSAPANDGFRVANFYGPDRRPNAERLLRALKETSNG